MPGSAPPPDESGVYSGQNLVLILSIVTLLSLAIYNSIELVLLILCTFRHYRGLYFWSLLLSGLLGVVPQAVSFILKDLNLAPLTFSLSLSTVGWYFMVTGQAVVLYSRLGLLVNDPRVLRRVLIMIITNAIILHVPTTILTYGSNFSKSNTAVWSKAYGIMERIELVGFSVQEMIISYLYVVQVIRNLRLVPLNSRIHRVHRKTLHYVLAINVFLILLDVVLLIMEFTNRYTIQTALKSLVYSIKLKLEFAVLNRLICLVRPDQMGSDDYWQPTPNPGPRTPNTLGHELTDFGGFSRVESCDTAALQRPTTHVVKIKQVFKS
ncbi:hypothetical protein POX_d05693 [Penicillium oxalicum]|uniref:DUF7703 domain-containing protein n=1 Tax=Penicillium oxalicum (strain 114-2 / CGMCC 5302) TaxID=933388 RepID=S7ZN72_PENO1|nr:hypothetical protein POX_d05693 [Penicillium oxalicum]EPS32130.1 hypothetical protein PDE_07089 [Penicillium oxalicum 114-2]KAI2790187.1 hypothetical protein POX_d05693 [Penicillium oxalicum]